MLVATEVLAEGRMLVVIEGLEGHPALAETEKLARGQKRPDVESLVENMLCIAE